MDLLFNNKKISGILTVIPENEVLFEDEMSNFNFSLAKSKKLAMVMGYKKHRIARQDQTSSDLCMHGLEYLIGNNLLDPSTINAIVFVSQTPDYQMPPTSNLIQSRLGLGNDVLCIDINQGCAGFEIGLLQSFMLLEQPAINRVVLLNADVLSHKVSRQDRNSWPLIGDAASVTIVESCDHSAPIHMTVNMDGNGAFAIHIPAGGARMPHTPDTAEMREDSAGNLRSLDHMVMQGDSVFNFVQREVPPMIKHLLEISGKNKQDIDWYMFHQPNKFMLRKVAEAIDVPYDKLPANIVENFGNASSVTVPMAITYNRGEALEHTTETMCIAGFGVGLTWSSTILQIGPLDFCRMIEG